MSLKERYPTLTYEPPKLPQAPRPDRTAIVLGRDANRAPVTLPLRARQEHCFVLGATGSGKSRMLQHFMRQAITNDEGLLFLDPHANDYRDLLAWLENKGRSVHVIDFSAPHVVGFNPLACPIGTDPSVIVGNVMDALSISWEGESFAQKPTIERNLSAVLAALVELKLTLCEAPLLLEHKDTHGLRRYAIEHVKDPYTRTELARIQEIAQDGRRRREFDQEIVGPANRLARLLRPPTIRAMLGQTENCLDFKSIMDNGEIVLANLSGGSQVYNRDADLFGRLLTRTVLFHAERRANTHPFNLVLDEAHRFFSSDIPVLLAEVRKRGVAIVAAMQWLEQARVYDENILAALLNSTNCKICFRLRDAEESEKLAHTLVPLNLERPVTTLVKPSVIGHQRIRLENESDSEQESVTDSHAVARGETRGFAETEGESVSYTHSQSSGRTDTESDSESHSESEGEGENKSSGQVMLPTSEQDTVISRETEGTGESASKSSSRGKSTSSGSAQSSSTTNSETHAQSHAITRSKSISRTQTEGKAVTRGTGHSRGNSEALEPILKDLPAAVHSMQNELYAAGRLLRNLPRAVGYLSYMGQSGAIATLFTVPPIISTPITDDAFSVLRASFTKESVTLPDALAIVQARNDIVYTTSVQPKKPKRASDDEKMW